MHPARRRAATAVLTVLPAGLLAGPVAAEDRHPARPVTLIVPQAPGGANDAIARIVAGKLTQQTGQQFLVENRAGAGGNIGTAAAAKLSCTVAPAGTPEAIVAQLHAERGKALDTPDARDKLAAVGCEPQRSSPEQLASLVKDELPRRAKIVKDSGATID